MRTHGTFGDVYDAAKSYYTGTAEDGCPMDAVVRREDGEWMLESGIEPARDADFECTLDAFDSYFFEAYPDHTFTPSEADATEFVEAMEG